jgi:integrase
VQNGKFTWIVRYRVNGVQRQRSLPGVLKLSRAREIAAEILVESRRGNDLVKNERMRRVEARVAPTRTVKFIVDRYLDAADLAPRTLRDARRYLTQHWRQLHDRDAETLDRRSIVALLEVMAKERGPVTANRAKSYLSTALTFGVMRGLIETNACTNIKTLFKETSRERVLNDDELRRVWGACSDDTHSRIVRLLILTAQRRNEVANIRWSEIEGNTWRLPATRTKNKRPHTVHLTAQALSLFPERRDKDVIFGFSNWSAPKRKLDERCGVQSWTLHDLRRTAATRMNELGVAPHIVEAILNHAKSGVGAIYNRATYLNEMRDALERWSSHVLQK